jgi:hypothetical protein
MSGQFRWSPVHLNRDGDSAVREFGKAIVSEDIQIDGTRARDADLLLRKAMAFSVGNIIGRDSLPHLCHIINGWGIGRYHGHSILGYLTQFIQRDSQGRAVVKQCHPEGDYHAWQSFAYAVMAGAKSSDVIPWSAVTLGELACSSNQLNTSDAAEFGHLLFALAHLACNDDLTIELQSRKLKIPQIVDEAIWAHQVGSFNVCRKFHLTEGLCAAVALLPGNEGYRDIVQAFLVGQLEMTVAMCVIAHIARSRALKPLDYRLWSSIHNSLAMAPVRENHYYYAGHLMELAAFAWLLGFEIAPIYRKALIKLANDLNERLPHNLSRIHFEEAHLHLGHYRRGLTLLPYLGNNRDAVDLQSYSVDFDLKWSSFDGADTAPDESCLIYSEAIPPKSARERFDAAVRAYEESAVPGFRPRGGYPHFRRIIPPGWPRAAHYELLDYGDAIGVEIHLESNGVLAARPTLVRLANTVSVQLNLLAEWDPQWWGARGRLRVKLLDTSCSATEVARCLRSLIDVTYDVLDPIISMANG